MTLAVPNGQSYLFMPLGPCRSLGVSKESEVREIKDLKICRAIIDRLPMLLEGKKYNQNTQDGEVVNASSQYQYGRVPSISSRRICPKPFERDTNLVSDNDETCTQFNKRIIVRNIFSVFLKLLFGLELSDSQRDQRTLREKFHELDGDNAVFLEQTLSSEFKERINAIFKEAKKLLQTQENETKKIKRCRLTLYSTSLLSIIGWSYKKKVCLTLASICSLASFVWLIKLHITSYYQNSLAVDEFKNKLTSLDNDLRLRSPVTQ